MKLIGIRTPDGARHVAESTATGHHPIATVEAFWSDPVSAIATWSSRVTSVPAVEGVLIPPVLDSARVFCVGLNYRDHISEGSYRDDPFPEHPTIFARWPSTLTVDGSPSPVPAGEPGLDWEGEVVAWVGRPLVDVGPDEARAAVIGYSVFNDLTSRTAQKLTSQWTLGKNGDASGPLGPLITADETGDPRDGWDLTTRVNGEIVQRGNTRDMVYELGSVLAHISHTIALKPGDLIATGTPSGVGYARTPPRFLHPGDVVTVDVSHIGLLTTPIVANDARYAFAKPGATAR